METKPDFNTERLDNKQAAEYLGIKPDTLNIWRSTGRYDLTYINVGRRVFYRKSDLDAFIHARQRTETVK